MKPFAFVALLVLTSVAYGQDAPVSLGEAAKSAKPAKKATRVITNDDIPSKPEPAADTKSEEASARTSGPNAPDGTASSDTAAKEASKEPAEPEAVAAARKYLDSLHVKMGGIEKDQETIQNKMEQATDAEKESLRAQLDNEKKAAEELKKQIEEGEKQLTAAKKEAGLPTGIAF